MNMQLRQCFATAKPFRLKKAKFCPASRFPKKASGVQKKPEYQILPSKKPNFHPDQQISVFIFTDTYTGLLYYVIIRFLCRAQSIIAKFTPTS